MDLFAIMLHIFFLDQLVQLLFEFNIIGLENIVTFIPQLLWNSSDNIVDLSVPLLEHIFLFINFDSSEDEEEHPAVILVNFDILNNDLGTLIVT